VVPEIALMSRRARTRTERMGAAVVDLAQLLLAHRAGVRNFIPR
jgi:hypothetical protein